MKKMMSVITVIIIISIIIAGFLLEFEQKKIRRRVEVLEQFLSIQLKENEELEEKIGILRKDQLLMLSKLGEAKKSEEIKEKK